MPALFSRPVLRNIQNAFRQPISGKVKMAMKIYRQRFIPMAARRPLRLLALALLSQGCVATAQAWTVVVDSAADASRSEEHTSELQSQSNLVCRLLLEKKKKYI